MKLRASGIDTVTLALVALLATTSVPAQTLRVTATNSSAPNAVYDVLFGPGQTTLLNADGNTFKSFRSAVFVPNAASAGTDLLVADTSGGSIVRYTGPTGTPPIASTPVWSVASYVPGPQRPDGMSVDAAGNLYVVTNSPAPQIWVLKPSPTAPGGYAAPLLLDCKFAGWEVDALVETVVVPATLPAAVQAALASNGIHAGDLLALVADNDFDPRDTHERITLFDYSALSIQKFLSDPRYPIKPPSIALREPQFPTTSSPGSPLPTGMDLWPVDGSLLIATNKGTILQYTLSGSGTASTFWTASSATTFAAIACGASSCPFHKLRTGAQADTAYAFVTQSTGNTTGNILQFAVPLATPTPYGGFGFTTPAASVASSASSNSFSTGGSPSGLALAHASVVVAAAADCASAAGCDPTGGLSHVILPGPAGVGPQGVHGNIIEQTCIVTDTRLKSDGTCPGTLDIAAQCPGFAANLIPPTMCGASGPHANQFAVVQTIANGVDDVPGILVQTMQNPDALIPGTAPTPDCEPQMALGWAPRLGSDEGTIPEGAAVVDITGYCDKAGGSTRGNSIWTIGGVLSPVVSSRRDLVRFANDKLVNLGKTIKSGNVDRPVQGVLDVCLITSALFLNTGHYACAARNVWECDKLVANSAKSFGSSPNNPNPYGDIRGRLGNLFYTINTRIQHNPPNPIWPLTAPPPACH
jgi:hypothetical protein